MRFKNGSSFNVCGLNSFLLTFIYGATNAVLNWHPRLFKSFKIVFQVSLIVVALLLSCLSTFEQDFIQKTSYSGINQKPTFIPNSSCSLIIFASFGREKTC